MNIHDAGPAKVIRAAGIAAIVLLVSLVYLNTLSNGFVYDDNFQILENTWIRDFRHLPDIFTSHSFAFREDSEPGRSYRPFVFVVYSVEYALFGLEPMGWHLVNVIIHATNSVLVYLILFAMLRGFRPPGSTGDPLFTLHLPPLIGAAVFAVHPVNNEVVAWVGCVPELTYTFLGLLAFYLHIISESPGRTVTGRAALKAFSGAFFLLAVLSKETAVAIPAIIFVYDRVARSGERLFSLRNVARYAPFAVAGALYMALRVYAIGGMAPVDRMYGFLSNYQYFLNAMVLFARYLGMLVFPANDYPFEILDPVLSALDPRALVSISVVAFLAIVLFLIRKRVSPLFLFAAFLVVFPLLPALYIPGLSRQSFAIRYLYLPSAGFGLMAALLLRHGLTEFLLKDKTVALRAALAVSLAILAVYSLSAAKRNIAWRDEVSVWEASIGGSQQNYFALYWLAMAHYKKNHFGEAIRYAGESIRVNTSRQYVDRMIEMFARRLMADVHVKTGRYDEAIEEYRETLRLSPGDFANTYNLAMTYYQKGLYDEAIEFYKRALGLARKNADIKDTLNNLANCYVKNGDFGEAISTYQLALEISPNDPVIINNMNTVMRLSGRTP